MRSKTIYRFAVIAILVLSFFGTSEADDGYFLSLYGGQVSNTQFHAIARGILDYEDYYLVALALGKELGVYQEKVGIEVEGQTVKHINGTEHWEYNAALNLRWLPFPWDDIVDTSFAWGNGFSYATQEPEFEIERSSQTGETSKWLYYFLVEWEFVHPEIPNWGVFTRIHHRSSVFGLIDGLIAGCNYVTFGVRYHFN